MFQIAQIFNDKVIECDSQLGHISKVILYFLQQPFDKLQRDSNFQLQYSFKQFQQNLKTKPSNIKDFQPPTLSDS
jgi:hypothetical protein